MDAVRMIATARAALGAASRPEERVAACRQALVAAERVAGCLAGAEDEERVGAEERAAAAALGEAAARARHGLPAPGPARYTGDLRARTVEGVVADPFVCLAALDGLLAEVGGMLVRLAAEEEGAPAPSRQPAPAGAAGSPPPNGPDDRDDPGDGEHPDAGERGSPEDVPACLLDVAAVDAAGEVRDRLQRLARVVELEPGRV